MTADTVPNGTSDSRPPHSASEVDFGGSIFSPENGHWTSNFMCWYPANKAFSFVSFTLSPVVYRCVLIFNICSAFTVCNMNTARSGNHLWERHPCPDRERMFPCWIPIAEWEPRRRLVRDVGLFWAFLPQTFLKIWNGNAFCSNPYCPDSHTFRI